MDIRITFGYIFLFFFLVNPVVNLDLPLILRAPDILLSALLSLFYLMYFRFRLPRPVYYFLLVVLCILTYCLGLELVYGLQNFEFITSQVRLTLNLLSALLIFRLFDKKVFINCVIYFFFSLPQCRVLIFKICIFSSLCNLFFI